MRLRILAVLLLISTGLGALPCAARAAGTRDVARWEREARDVTIYRDNWGIAHVYGKTDADAVFGMEYAQAQDDFNRVETELLRCAGVAVARPRASPRSTATCAGSCSSIRRCCRPSTGRVRSG